jgi:hypothetical protein
MWVYVELQVALLKLLRSEKGWHNPRASPASGGKKTRECVQTEAILLKEGLSSVIDDS